MKKKILFCMFLACTLSLQAGEPFKVAFFLLEPYTMADPKSGDASGAVIDYWHEYIGPALELELISAQAYRLAKLRKLRTRYAWTPAGG